MYFFDEQLSLRLPLCTASAALLPIFNGEHQCLLRMLHVTLRRLSRCFTVTCGNGFNNGAMRNFLI